MSPPKFVKFEGVETATKDGLHLLFLGVDNQRYSAILAVEAIPATLAALLTMGGKIGAGRPATKTQPVVVQPLLPTGFGIGGTEAGHPTIYIYFGEAGALPIQLTRKQLKDVKRLVAELDRLSVPKSGKATH